MLWDNTTRFVFTLAAAVVGLVAYFLFPSRAQVEQKLTEAYDRWKKWALFIIAFLVLGLAGILGWEFFRYNVQNGWVEINLALYSAMGTVLLVANILTMRAVKHAAEHVEIVEAEMVELSAYEGGHSDLPGAGAAPASLPPPPPPEPAAGQDDADAPKE